MKQEKNQNQSIPNAGKTAHTKGGNNGTTQVFLGSRSQTIRNEGVRVANTAQVTKRAMPEGAFMKGGLFQRTQHTLRERKRHACSYNAGKCAIRNKPRGRRKNASWEDANNKFTDCQRRREQGVKTRRGSRAARKKMGGDSVKIVHQ